MCSLLNAPHVLQNFLHYKWAQDAAETPNETMKLVVSILHSIGAAYKESRTGSNLTKSMLKLKKTVS
jgi:hypothetical protein